MDKDFFKDNSFEFNIGVPLIDKWDDIRLLRLSISGSIQILFNNRDYENAVSMTTAELIENAMKYSQRINGETNIYFYMTAGRAKVSIEASNYFDPKSCNIEKLKNTIDKLKSYDDPYKAYTDKLKEFSNEKDDKKDFNFCSNERCSSELGFYRIFYEGGFNLDYEIKDNLVTVKADFRFF